MASKTKPPKRNPAFVVHNCLTAMAHGLLVDVLPRDERRPARRGHIVRWETGAKDEPYFVLDDDGGAVPVWLEEIERIASVRSPDGSRAR